VSLVLVGNLYRTGFLQINFYIIRRHQKSWNSFNIVLTFPAKKGSVFPVYFFLFLSYHYSRTCTKKIDVTVHFNTQFDMEHTSSGFFFKIWQISVIVMIWSYISKCRAPNQIILDNNDTKNKAPFVNFFWKKVRSDLEKKNKMFDKQFFF
jgi:hypothetical protein